MPRFIHLTDERLLVKLKKSGISMTRWGAKTRCVYATPVLPDFQVSHQVPGARNAVTVGDCDHDDRFGEQRHVLARGGYGN